MQLRPLVAAAALALVVGACGDDEGSVDRTATEIEETASEAASDAAETASEAADEAEDAAGEAASEAEDAAGDAADQARDVDPSEAGEAAGDAAGDVVEALRERGLTNLATAIEAIGVENVVPDGPFTLLAPNDQAFLSLGADQLAALLSNPQQAGEVLRDHVLGEKLTSSDLAGVDEVQTSAGNTLAVSASGDAVTIGGATVTEADIEVGEGVIHVVDAVVDSGATAAAGS